MQYNRRHVQTTMNLSELTDFHLECLASLKHFGLLETHDLDKLFPGPRVYIAKRKSDGQCRRIEIHANQTRQECIEYLAD